MKDTFDNIDKLVSLLKSLMSKDELTYFHSFLLDDEDSIWELENLYPDPSDQDVEDMLVELHEVFNDNLWDEDDIIRAIHLAHLLTQAPNAESAEQIIDVWLTTYWDSAYSGAEDQINIEHIKSILREELQ